MKKTIIFITGLVFVFTVFYLYVVNSANYIEKKDLEALLSTELPDERVFFYQSCPISPGLMDTIRDDEFLVTQEYIKFSATQIEVEQLAEKLALQSVPLSAPSIFCFTPWWDLETPTKTYLLQRSSSPISGDYMSFEMYFDKGTVFIVMMKLGHS